MSAFTESKKKQEEEEEDDEEEEVMDEWKDMWRKYGYQGTYKPVHFVGPISDIVKKLSEGLQITRVRCAWITGNGGREKEEGGREREGGREGGKE